MTVVVDTSKQTDCPKVEGKKRKMRKIIEASVLLNSCLFIDLLDSAKIFSLSSQHADTDIMLIVDRIDDIKLTYQLFHQKFKSSPESVFELPYLRNF